MIGSEVLTQESTTVTIRLTYRQIADDMAARIDAGEYLPGDELPSYHALADMYSVSRATASRAYGLLRDRGKVVGTAGRGVYVAKQ